MKEPVLLTNGMPLHCLTCKLHGEEEPIYFASEPTRETTPSGNIIESRQAGCARGHTMTVRRFMGLEGQEVA